MDGAINDARILQAMEAKQLKVVDACAFCGVNNKTLAKILRGKMPRRIDAFYRVVNGLQIPFQEAVIAPHIKQRKDRGSTWYLIDGSLTKSLKTTKKGLAQHCLEQYIKGKYGLTPTPTVKEYFDSWIKTKVEPLFRRAQVRDYSQHFRAYILPVFKDRRLSAIGTGELIEFRGRLLGRGLKVEKREKHHRRVV